MNTILDTSEVESLVTLVEEAARSTAEGVKRFVEPAQGTLRRATNKRHHMIFGRRGSGKSRLLRKAAADLTIDRRPIAYGDLEAFKAHSYPDVLLSILISTFREFENWLRTAAIHPAHKTTFWQWLFGTKPQRPPFNRKQAEQLANELRSQVSELEGQLHSADNISTSSTIRESSESNSGSELGVLSAVPRLTSPPNSRTGNGQESPRSFRRRIASPKQTFSTDTSLTISASSAS
jgi:hypothetical protein